MVDASEIKGTNTMPSIVVSRYYNTAVIRKKYHNIQTIEISSINF